MFVFRFIIVVEHDLSVLDYLSDFICCLYGVPGAYGVVTMPFSVREGKRFCEFIFFSMRVVMLDKVTLLKMKFFFFRNQYFP